MFQINIEHLKIPTLTYILNNLDKVLPKSWTRGDRENNLRESFFLMLKH